MSERVRWGWWDAPMVALACELQVDVEVTWEASL